MIDITYLVFLVGVLIGAAMGAAVVWQVMLLGTEHAIDKMVTSGIFNWKTETFRVTRFRAQKKDLHNER